MPTPNENERKEDFIKRCIPQVIRDGTTDRPDQAVAICESIWTQSKTKSDNSYQKDKYDFCHQCNSELLGWFSSCPLCNSELYGKSIV